MGNVYIKFKSDGQVQEIDSGNHELLAGEEVLVEGEYGLEIAFVVQKELFLQQKEEEGRDAKEKKAVVFIRKLNESDKEKAKKLNLVAKDFLEECRGKIAKYDLPMQLIDADLSFDEKKLTFYFTAPSRVDFRLLVSDLAHTFKKVIRLQQIGSRDEARYLGGVGRCGQLLCCKRFLKGNLESVTLDMATVQNLSGSGSNRVTGVCGKLMCCLKYELENYKDTKKNMPEIRSEYKTPSGKGIVISQNVVKNSISVKLDEGGQIVEVKC